MAILSGTVELACTGDLILLADLQRLAQATLSSAQAGRALVLEEAFVQLGHQW